MKLKQLAAPVATAALLASSFADAAWQNNGNEYDIGGLDTFLYVPATAPALDGKRALMISMHGCSQPNNDFKAGAGWPPVADQYGMVVALPQASGEGTYGALLKCWNFHVGMQMSRTSSDAKYLLDLVDELLADSSLNIDPNQVYITGLSSGAGMTNSIGCLAPDYFAGVGVNAGPGPGSGGTDLSNPSISVSQGESNCETLSNKNGANAQSHLYTQLHNQVHGTADGSVDDSHAHRNADIAVAVYDDDDTISTCTVNPGTIPGAQSGNHGVLTEWCGSDGKPRVSKILVQGMGHAWPAGNNSSGGGNYIDHDHINYPEWITDWFFDNNMRVGSQPPPADSDGDGVPDSQDQCPNTPAGTNVDANGCEIPAGSDSDGDGVDDSVDNCPNDANANQADTDGDGVGDACDATPNGDSDGDGVDNNSDNCPNDANADQADNDSDGLGNVCDPTPNGGSGSCSEFTSANTTHVTLGRAYVLFGLTYAVGSGDSMGLWNIFTTRTLKETSNNYYELGSCP